jgi:hypothetical protein
VLLVTVGEHRRRRALIVSGHFIDVATFHSVKRARAKSRLLKTVIVHGHRRDTRFATRKAAPVEPWPLLRVLVCRWL